MLYLTISKLSEVVTHPAGLQIRACDFRHTRRLNESAFCHGYFTTVRPGATVNLFGGCPRDTTISVSTEQLHYSELTLKRVFHNTPKYVREALSLLASKVIPF